MSDVRIQIGGRSYDVHCADGQEAALAELAAMVDAKIAGVGAGGEARQLMFAALLLADAAKEQEAKLAEALPAMAKVSDAYAAAQARAEALAAALATANARIAALEAKAAAPPPPAANGQMDAVLARLADRVEAIAGQIAGRA